jgi:antirestriction protein ArdC
MTKTATKTKPKSRKYDGPSSEELLTADLVALMESAELPPWRREWAGHQGQHRNLITGHTYRGSNPILLEIGSMLRGHTLPLWLGGAEAKARGWWPRKGSKACRIVRPQLNKREQTDANGQPVTGPDGSQLVAAWVSFKPVAVFNAADLQGHDEETAAALAAAIAEAIGQGEAKPAAARLEAAEAVLEAWPVDTRWGGALACYDPNLDRISMPAAEAFTTREAMAATWAHEQSHSTGHKSRLDRAMGKSFGNESYAREELVAELSAVLICYRLQIGCQLENHAAYLQHWAQLLKEGGPRVLFQVLSDARKAADLIAPEAIEEA